MGVIAPESPGSYAVFLFWIIFVYQSFRHLASGNPRRRGFAQGFLLACLAIAGAQMLGDWLIKSATMILSWTGIVDEYDFGAAAILHRRTLAAHGALWLALAVGAISKFRGARPAPEDLDPCGAVSVHPGEAMEG